MLVLLSGGTGGVKLLSGLKEVYQEEKLAVIVNTADDKWLPHGYFSPDIDSVLYALAGLIDEDRWYGLKGDTYNTHEMLRILGYDEFLNIGDKDRAIHIYRGEMLKEMKLCGIVERLRKVFKIKVKVFPMSNDKVTTMILTPRGMMDIQEFLVKNRAELEVLDVYFDGIEKARACSHALDSIKKADGIIIGPSNPITSILPILSIKEIGREIKRKMDKCVAVSPLIRGKAVSGPAEKFLRAKGYTPTIESLIEIYGGYISKLVVDEKEEVETREIEIYKTKILMKTQRDRETLAKFLLELLGV
ncbi:MAG: 2-phospho-L-lactate transferase [Thermoplasmata archaeon]|nr:MAG: 2-phospho-L-lactate transferase [Thermoplasmata archaeon]